MNWLLSFFRPLHPEGQVRGGYDLAPALLARGFEPKAPITPKLPAWARPNHERRKRELRGW